MTAPSGRPSAAVLEQLREVAERRLTPEEVAASLAVPVSERERDELLSLVRWFRGRYKTPLERLAYARRAYRRWNRNR